MVRLRCTGTPTRQTRFVWHRVQCHGVRRLKRIRAARRRVGMGIRAGPGGVSRAPNSRSAVVGPGHQVGPAASAAIPSCATGLDRTPNPTLILDREGELQASRKPHRLGAGCFRALSPRPSPFHATSLALGSKLELEESPASSIELQASRPHAVRGRNRITRRIPLAETRVRSVKSVYEIGTRKSVTIVDATSPPMTDTASVS